jgi:2-amino-4-hydroxy-6-hydroxymethyldihydropteridine diphosphokinase
MLSIMPRALLALGANEGDCAATFAAALQSLMAQPDIHEISRSSWRETAPIGGPGVQAAFLNGACLIDTSLSPHDLWGRLAATESAFGRLRVEHWGARTLDLDLLLYDEQVITDDVLTVPHSRFALRRFVLEPAAEIAGAMLHPTLGCTIDEIWGHVQSTPQQATVLGGKPEDRAHLASRIVSHREAWPLIEGGTQRPRLSIKLQEFDDVARDAKRRVMTQWDGRLLLLVNVFNLDDAAQEAVLAMQGLAE